MFGRFGLTDLLTVSLILALILLAGYRGWGRGWWPPRGPFSH
jgi:hypothetical protein